MPGITPLGSKPYANSAISVGFSPKPTSGTATASTATGGKVWPTLTRVRDRGRNSAPLARVTPMPSATATSVLAAAAAITVPRWASVSVSRSP